MCASVCTSEAHIFSLTLSFFLPSRFLRSKLIYISFWRLMHIPKWNLSSSTASAPHQQQQKHHIVHVIIFLWIFLFLHSSFSFLVFDMNKEWKRHNVCVAYESERVL